MKVDVSLKVAMQNLHRAFYAKSWFHWQPCSGHTHAQVQQCNYKMHRVVPETPSCSQKYVSWNVALSCM